MVSKNEPQFFSELAVVKILTDVESVIKNSHKQRSEASVHLFSKTSNRKSIFHIRNLSVINI